MAVVYRVPAHSRQQRVATSHALGPVAATSGGPLNVAVDVAVLTLTGVDVTAAGTGAATAAVDVATLTLTGLTPGAAGSGVVVVTADVATLTLTGQDVEAGTAGGSATVDPAVLTLTGQDVTAAGTGTASVVADTATLTLTGVTPAAAGSGATTVTVDVAALTLTGQTPTAAGSGVAVVTVDVAILTLTGQDVIASAGAIFAITDPAILTLTGLTPTAAGTGAASVTVDPAALALTGLTPTAAGTGVAAVPVDPAILTLTGQTPAAAGTGAVTRTVDPAILTLTGVDIDAFAVPLFVIGRATSTLTGASAGSTLRPAAEPSYLTPTVGTVTTPDPGPLPNECTFVYKVSGTLAAGTHVVASWWSAAASWLLYRQAGAAPDYEGLTLNTSAGLTGRVQVNSLVPAVDVLAASLTIDDGADISWFTLRRLVDGVWVDIGTTSYAAVDLIPATGDPVRIGAYGIANEPYGGRIYWVELRTGLDPAAGTLVWRFDASEHTTGTTWTSRGRTWTVTTAAAITHPDAVTATSELVAANATSTVHMED